MELYSNEALFLCSTRLGEQVIRYVRRDPELRDLPLQFEYGLVDGTTRVVGRFSGRKAGKRAVVWVSVSLLYDDQLQLTHALSWLS